MIKRLLRVTSLAAPLLLVACGGGSGSDPVQTATVIEPREDTVTSTGGNSVIQALVSDQTDNSFTRALYTFTLPVFPLGTEIVSATLHTTLTSSDGGLFPARGPIVLDHVDSSLGIIAAASATSLLDAFAVLASDATVGPRDATVTAAVRADLAAGRTKCRLRMRHRDGDTNGDGIGDFTRFGSTNDLPRATLEIRFR